MPFINLHKSSWPFNCFVRCNSSQQMLWMLSLIVMMSATLISFPTEAFYVKFASHLRVNAAGAQVTCCTQVIDTGELAQHSVIQPLESVTDTSDYGDATISLQGEAALGRLKARATGSASQIYYPTSDHSYYSVGPTPYEGAIPEWSDTLTMGAGAFKFTIKLVSQVSGGPVSSGALNRGVHCDATSARLNFGIVYQNLIAMELVDNFCDGNQGLQTFTDSVTLSYGGGEQVTVTGKLFISMYGDATEDISPASTVDVLNTAIFTIDPVTLGATYTSESGVSYETSICCTVTTTTGTGGSISPSGAVSVTPGDNQTFTIIPDQGYEIEDVTVDGVSQGVITSYTFPNVQDDHTISATFAVRKSVGLPFIPLLIDE